MTRTDEWIDKHPRLADLLIPLLGPVDLIDWFLSGARRNGRMLWRYQRMSTDEYFRWMMQLVRRAGYGEV